MKTTIGNFEVTGTPQEMAEFFGYLDSVKESVVVKVSVSDEVGLEDSTTTVTSTEKPKKVSKKMVGWKVKDRKKYNRMTFQERDYLQKRLRDGVSLKQISEELDRPTTTLSYNKMNQHKSGSVILNRDKRHVKTLYRQGMRRRKISEVTGIAYSTVCEIIRTKITKKQRPSRQWRKEMNQRARIIKAKEGITWIEALKKVKKA